MPGKVPRPFKLHWGSGQVVEEAFFEGEYHVPAIQLLEFEDGHQSVRFCFFNQRGAFQRDPLVLGGDDLKAMRTALKQTPQLHRLMSSLVK